MPASEPISESARQTWLDHLREQKKFDRELARILREAANEGERIVNAIVADSVGAITRQAQMKIAVAQLRIVADRMWASVNAQLVLASQRQISLAAEGVAAIDDILFRAIGSTALRESIEAATNVAIQNVVAKSINSIELSQQVYRTQALANGWVDRVVSQGILLNKSAREIARDVRRFIRPDVPGGVSYAARRLARTELNNAFHTTTILTAQDLPWTEGFQWNLSSSHPRPDPCDEYAHANHDNLGAGVYAPDNVPVKPHPQCLCYITTVMPNDEDFINRLISGKYDRWLRSNGFVESS